MKAKDYFAKYNTEMRGAAFIHPNAKILQKTMCDMHWEMFKEMLDVMRSRNAISDAALASLIEEFNAKGNKIAEMFKPAILKKDWFRDLTEKMLGLKSNN